ncbi:MAG: heavy metal-binding domain-containing protein, partial [Cyanobacteria bacterium SZAS LIN-2]|nr:heavy metal-binding domain-containing protein [Cyanobacteria bacterium SZAS LIN-2]
MGFWKKDTPAELERKALQARQEADQLESITKLQQGYLPVAASRRLQKQADMGGSFFSSTLSIPEYLLARQVGLQPLSQVMGTTFMRVEPEEGDGIMSEVSGELIYLATAKSSAQALAVERLRMEGKALGAHGIIGVKLQTSEFSWSRGFAQFTAVGTAVRLPDSQMLREAKNLPFTSTLSGQEFWQLYESGYWPCGLVIGNGIYLAANRWGIPFGMTPTLNATYVQAAAMQMNCELKGFSDGISLAREAAMKNLSHEIKSV